MGGRGVAGVSRQFLGGGRIVSRCGGVSAAGMGAVSGRRRRDSGLFAGRGVSAAVVRKPGFPECPFAPPAGEFINQRQERETQEVETDLVPTTTMAKEFVEKLEGIVDAHAELQMQREVYMSLIRRVKSHFDCLGVCWR